MCHPELVSGSITPASHCALRDFFCPNLFSALTHFNFTSYGYIILYMTDKTKHFFTVALVILISGILDFAVSTLVQDVLHAPLFFDMTFAMAVLFAYGVFPAILTYVVNVICGCLKLVILYGKNDYIYLFTLSALTIILITWLFVRKKENLKKGVNFVFIYILLAAVCAALACSVVSGIISYFTFSLVMEAGPFDKFIFAFSGDQMGVLASCIVGRIPITILDRVITTFAGFGIYLLYSSLRAKRSNP